MKSTLCSHECDTCIVFKTQLSFQNLQERDHATNGPDTKSTLCSHEYDTCIVLKK